MRMILAIALGGAFGAVSRHFIAAAVGRQMGHGFPWGTLAVNLLGSFIMGFMIVYFTHRLNLSNEVKALITVGFLGSLTTFSTFSMEIGKFIETAQYGSAAIYIGVSVVIGVAALFLGMTTGRLLV